MFKFVFILLIWFCKLLTSDFSREIKLFKDTIVLFNEVKLLEILVLAFAKLVCNVLIFDTFKLFALCKVPIFDLLVTLSALNEFTFDCNVEIFD